MRYTNQHFTKWMKYLTKERAHGVDRNNTQTDTHISGVNWRYNIAQNKCVMFV